jgi:hypothetical protein
MSTSEPASEGPPHASAARDISLPTLAIITLQLAIAVAVISRFTIHNNAFSRLAQLALGAFVVHALLPRRWRLLFFVALSVAGILLVLGFTYGLALLGAAAVFITICHLPIPIWARALLACIGGGVLAAINLLWIDWPAMRLVVPILGSMFMFRMIVCLYDLSHATAKNKPTILQTCAYFLLLPNVCFLLFPIVDYRTSISTYYDTRPEDIYRSGVRWMFIAVLHQLVYRLLLYHFQIKPDHVETSFDRIRFIYGDFLLYVRISGEFHLCIGILQLFGFNLPRTHRNYFLASSLTDFWRRCNLYWTAFMQKLVFYPVSFRLRKAKWSPMAITVTASIVVMLATWALHWYQAFWLTCKLPPIPQDPIWWTILGSALVITTAYEQRHGRQRSLSGQPKRTVGGWIQTAALTFVTFTFMSMLWSFWSSSSVDDWTRIVFDL